MKSDTETSNEKCSNKRGGGYCDNHLSWQQYFGELKKLYMSFSNFLLTDLCEIMYLKKSSALRAAVYLNWEKNIYQRFVYFASGLGKINSMS